MVCSVCCSCPVTNHSRCMIQWFKRSKVPVPGFVWPLYASLCAGCCSRGVFLRPFPWLYYPVKSSLCFCLFPSSYTGFLFCSGAVWDIPDLLLGSQSVPREQLSGWAAIVASCQFQNSMFKGTHPGPPVSSMGHSHCSLQLLWWWMQQACQHCPKLPGFGAGWGVFGTVNGFICWLCCSWCSQASGLSQDPTAIHVLGSAGWWRGFRKET